MLIFSQNLANYGFPIPQDAIFRVNLAWINSLKELEIKYGYGYAAFLNHS